MNWYAIRLELASNPEFPTGSASRAVLLHLPLDKKGLIDKAALRHKPWRATVHRFWPNERDQTGHIIRTPYGWGLSFKPGEEDGQGIAHLEMQPIRPGEKVSLIESSGSKLPFLVAGFRRLA